MIGSSNTQYSTLKLLRPAYNWPRPQASQLRGDFESALIGAFIAIPQAIALAALAGLPPQYGIYTSIVPVMLAILWGSSWFLVSGPNTAMSLMLAAAVAPLALPGESPYLGYILLLTLMVGLIQLGAGLVRAGSLLNFVSNTVIVAITHAVALMMILSALASVLGLKLDPTAGFFLKCWQLMTQLSDSNPWTLSIALLVVGVGLLSRLWSRRYALLLGLIAGTLAVYLWTHYANGDADLIPLLGSFQLSLFAWSTPISDASTYGVMRNLLGSAMVIAFVGLMQSVVISRSLALKSGQNIDANRECVGQGVANLVAPFISAFAGSGSFNRSAAHLQLGARTPMALIYSALLLLFLVFAAQPLLAIIPQPAIAAMLILIGIGLLDFSAIRRILLSRQETIIFISALIISLVFGLTEGVLTGVLLSLVIYLKRTSVPRVNLSERRSRDGRPVTEVGIDGNLFFGSVAVIEQCLPMPNGSEAMDSILLLRTNHLTYLDIPGAELLLRQVGIWRKAGHDSYISVDRPEQLEIFKRTGMLAGKDEDWIIRRDRHHVMKDLLNPFSDSATLTGKALANNNTAEEYTVQELALRLHATPLLGPVPIKRLTELLEKQPILSAESGDIIVRAEDSLNEHLVLLEGELEAQRIWTTPDGREKSYTWILKPENSDSNPAILTAASNRLRVRALQDIQYLKLDADVIDEFLGWNLQSSADEKPEHEINTRMALVRQIGVFHHIPLERVQEAFQRMRPVSFNVGDEVVREGEKGDRYFVIEEGEVEVIRTDPFTDETRTVDHMAAGDGFGEESLLQDGYRNATIRMLTPGKLLELTRDDFEALIRPSMVKEVAAETVKSMLDKGEVKLLDCRYDLEYEESRIPNAKLIPLHVLRFQLQDLDPDALYIVYCRSGRRSKAAAFLLKERNFNAISLAGGIKNWPFEVDASPISL